MISHKSFTILPIAIPIPDGSGHKYRSLVRNWRGAEPIKCYQVFDTRDESIAHTKALIDEYFVSHKGVI